MSGWADVERDPRAFLALRLCRAAWLEQALPSLRAAARDDGGGDAVIGNSAPRAWP